MAVVIVSLIGVAAIAVLLACLRGFSRVARQEEVRGLLARVSCKQEGQTRLLDMPISATSRDHTTSVVSSLSKNTAGVVRLAIVLRSKGAGSAAVMPSPLLPKSGGGARPRDERLWEDRRRRRS
jgi:hypothetical protein